MQPFPVSVAELLGEHGASLHLEGDVELGSFSVGQEHFEGIAPAHFALDLTNTGSGIVAMGDISGEVRAECSRCLCYFPLLVTGEIEGFYVEDRYRDEIPEETDAEPIRADATVDVGPALMSAITLEVPFAPLHDPECEGLCATCGADLNEGPCGCDSASGPANPFAALKALLPEDAGSGHGAPEDASAATGSSSNSDQG